MLVVKTKIKSSKIHGIGVFAEEVIPKGTAIWKYDKHIDVLYYNDAVEQMSSTALEFIKTYGWLWHDTDKSYYTISIDNTRFVNYSKTPNCVMAEDGSMVATHDITIGEELTENYEEYDDEFSLYMDNLK